jgi:hypothetical protein
MKSESGRMKGDSNAKDEKMRAENGRIKGDLKERAKEFALNIIGLYSQLSKRREAQIWHLRGSTLSGGATLELLEGARFCRRDQLEPLANEAD